MGVEPEPEKVQKDNVDIALPLEGITIKDSETEEPEKEGLGWRRYLGVVYTLLSTNAFSLYTTILKKYSHIHPFTLGVWAFPLAAVFSIPFIYYTVYVEKKSVIDTIWPISKHKKVCFFIWVSL